MVFSAAAISAAMATISLPTAAHARFLPRQPADACSDRGIARHVTIVDIEQLAETGQRLAGLSIAAKSAPVAVEKSPRQRDRDGGSRRNPAGCRCRK